MQTYLSRRGFAGTGTAFAVALLLAACGEEEAGTTGGANVAAADLLVETD